jgi:putative membrane protein
MYDAQSKVTEPTSDLKDWKKAPLLWLKGFLMGSADVVPGVSGGTMALITGIYTPLLDAIKSVDRHALSHLLRFRFRALFEGVHWRFLLVLLTGIFTAILFFTRVIPLPELLFTHPEIIYGLFFGLILGSIYLLLKDVYPFSIAQSGFLLIGTALGYWVVNLVPTSTPDTWWFIFFSGAIAICAMILPGISGSFILLILGKYSFIFGQFKELGGPETMQALTILFIFGLGVLTGISLFSRVLSWTLHRYTRQTLLVLIGFLIGSIVVIWPWQERSYEYLREEVVVSLEDSRYRAALSGEVDPRLPEYDVVLETDVERGTAQLVHISKKLIHAEPRIPIASDPVMIPVLMLMSGLCLVLVIGYLGKQKQGPQKA